MELARRLGLYGARVDKYLEVIKPYIDDARTILDLGCGRGEFARRLSGEARQVIALDIDCEALSNVDDPLTQKLCADAENIPLRDESVDVVIAISLLEHLHDPGKCLHEVNRVLREGGYLAIQLPNLQYYIEPHTKLPLLLLPYRFKETVRARINYPYINFKVTIKNLSRWIPPTLRLIEKTNLYHRIRTPPWPPAWILIYRKTPRHTQWTCSS